MIIISLALSIQVYKPKIFIELADSMKWLYILSFYHFGTWENFIPQQWLCDAHCVIQKISRLIRSALCE